MCDLSSQGALNSDERRREAREPDEVDVVEEVGELVEHVVEQHLLVVLVDGGEVVAHRTKCRPGWGERH